MEHRKHLHCKFQRKQSSMEVFVRRGPRFGCEFLESSNDCNIRTTCHLNSPKVPQDLTGIQQDQVDSGVTLDEALLMHDEWLEINGIKNSNFAVVTWSICDCQVMLESECKFKKIPKPAYFNMWIDLRVPFHEVFGDMRCKLKKAVEIAGLEWEGRAHSGLDDAKNTARLLALIMHKGYKFSITNSLSWKQSEERATVFHDRNYNMTIIPIVQYPPPPLFFHRGIMMNTLVVLFTPSITF
ncbi:uncharacterized protein LOC133314309 [Gastrolobium bilobum]|uniref:uncharacterized protein LOC133314309 n=1 Tax=Gastrolobium bilobum TaxID=150636 RepID=UPI002AB2988B|nr:uncharacterized protein LOC133314309 [Gastrolobium bilobum]